MRKSALRWRQSCTERMHRDMTLEFTPVSNKTMEDTTMIKLIIGKKGSGKTKLLIDKVNTAVQNTNGYVVCIEKGMKLTFEIDHAGSSD